MMMMMISKIFQSNDNDHKASIKGHRMMEVSSQYHDYHAARQTYAKPATRSARLLLMRKATTTTTTTTTTAMTLLLSLLLPLIVLNGSTAFQTSYRPPRRSPSSIITVGSTPSAFYSSEITDDTKVIAILGGDLAGVVAAISASQQERHVKGDNNDNNKHDDDDEDGESQNGKKLQVLLLTGCNQVLEELSPSSKEEEDSPFIVLPDPTWNNRQLIQNGFARGGRELAGILAKQCRPSTIRNWLVAKEDQNHHGVGLELSDLTGDISTLSKYQPLAVSNRNALKESLEAALQNAGITVLKEVNITKVMALPEEEGGFKLVWNVSNNYNNNKNNNNNNPQEQQDDSDSTTTCSLKADAIIISGDTVEFGQSYDNAVQDESSVLSTNNGNDMLDGWFEDEPLSRKEQMALEKKRRKATKKKKKTTTEETAVSYQDNIDNSTESLNDNVPSAFETTTTTTNDSQVTDKSIPPSISAVDIARSMGHSASDYIPGLFDFILDGGGNDSPSTSSSTRSDMPAECGTEIVPRARIRCKLKSPPLKKRKGGSKGRLPKVEGTLVVSHNTGVVSGFAALRLSSLIAQELYDVQYEGITLHIHFAPDIGGVDAIEEVLEERANPKYAVRQACPLEYTEIDYEDYDFDTGSFRSISYPLIPDTMWKQLCDHAKLTSPKTKWKDLSPKQRQELVRWIVDYPLDFKRIRPVAAAAAGGVDLKEVSMSDCQSRVAEGLFLCGSALDIHGCNEGCHRLSAIATGYLVGVKALEQTSR